MKFMEISLLEWTGFLCEKGSPIELQALVDYKKRGREKV